MTEQEAAAQQASNDYNQVWDTLAEARDAQTNVCGMVVDVVRGGLVVDLGVRAFVPKSEIATRNLNNLDRYIGQTVEAKVVEADKESGRVVLSERKVANEHRAVQRGELLQTLEKGQVFEGEVRRITDFGAFVDIGGVDGLLHVSDMAWERVEKPSDIVKVGDTVQVMVLKFDRDTQKISLGMKQLQDDPWNAARNEVREGDLIDVVITRIEPFGAVAKLMDGVEGVIPEREMGGRREEAEQVAAKLEPGQTVTVKVLEFRQRERRLTFSIKQVQRERERSETRDYMKRQRQEDTATPTLGDLFGDVFSKLQKKD